MTIRLCKLIVITLDILILLTFISCNKVTESLSDSKPVISTDVPVDDVNNRETRGLSPVFLLIFKSSIKLKEVIILKNFISKGYLLDKSAV